MSVENYKNVVIGSGEGGKYLAWHLAQSGQQTVVMAVVQTAMLGGLPHTALRDAILTHPTMAEGLNALFSSVKQANARVASR